MTKKSHICGDPNEACDSDCLNRAYDFQDLRAVIAELRAEVQRLQGEIERRDNALADRDFHAVMAPKQCENGENCACAIGTRHFWFVTFSEERDKLQRVEAARAALEALVTDLQAHSREHGWQDVDEPIAALLAWKAEAR